MNPTDFLEELKNLPPETALTASHVAAIFEVIAHTLDKPLKKATDFDSLSSSQLINEELLAEWIAEPVKTIQYWRAKGTGPEYVKSKSGSVRYKVGTIQKWIDDNTISNTAQGTARGILKLEGYLFNSPVPTMMYGEERADFFDSLYRDNEPSGYSLTSNQFYKSGSENVAAWVYDAMPHELLHDIEVGIDEFEGADINQKAALHIDGQISHYTIADLLAQYEGDDVGFGDLFISLMNKGLDISEVSDPKALFARTLNTYTLYKKLHDSLEEKK